jgi:anti-sigma factor RsiW
MPNAHLNDVEMLRALDRELSDSHAARVRAHLATCAECRERREQLASLSESLASAHRSDSIDELTDISLERARLRTQLEVVAARDSAQHAWWRVSLPMALQLGAVACGVALLAFATARWMLPPPGSGTSSAMAVVGNVKLAAQRAAEPNPALTPGAVRNVTLTEVCAMRHEEVELSVPDSVRTAVFREYGITDARPENYEVDYLIAPGLGGTADIHNLWPEPYASDAWNARVKDELEEYLHQSVCSGKVDLRTAQADISRDWIAAYKKYFRTESPLSTPVATTASATFAPDRRALIPTFQGAL